MLIQIIIIQSFTSFSQKAAEIFDLENNYFSSLHKRNGSWKVRKIVGTGFWDIIIGELPVQNNKVLRRIWVFCAA